MRFEALLFDFDGVVVDSEPIHWACWRKVLEPLEVDLPWDYYHAHFIGVSDKRMAEVIAGMGPASVTTADILAAYPRKTELFRAEMASRLPFSPGVPELLAELNSHYRLAVVTSSRKSEVEPVLRAGHLLPLLRTVIYADDVARHKPDPEPYRKAAELLEISRALVIEDSEAGETSGKAAGFPVLRVSSPDEVAPSVRRAIA